MFSSTAGKPERMSDTQRVSHDAGSLMTRKIWLPKTLYDLLPYFYLIAGVSALLASLYIGNWLWALPHYLLFSVACLHLGAVIYRRRHRPRP